MAQTGDSNASLQLISRTETSIVVRLIKLDSDYDGKSRSITWKIIDQNTGEDISESVKHGSNNFSLPNKITTSSSFYIGGLEAGTAYKVIAIILYYDGETEYEVTRTLNTATEVQTYTEEIEEPGSQLQFLMPPIFNSVFPAFVPKGNTIKIPYKDSAYNSSVIGERYINYKLMKLNTNKILASGRGQEENIDEVADKNKLACSISYSEWEPGIYYKVQGQFKVFDKGSQLIAESDWSTPIVFKVIEQPEISLAGADENLENTEEFWYSTVQTPTFEGYYKTKGNEGVGRFKFELWADDQLIETSDWITHNSITDSIKNNYLLSNDSYTFNQTFEQGVDYIVKYSVETENLYTETKKYRVRFILPLEKTEGITFEAFDTEFKNVSYRRKVYHNEEKEYKEIQTEYTTEAIDHKIEVSEEEGYTKLKIKINLDNIKQDEKPSYYKLLRASSKDNFRTWEHLVSFSAYRTEFEFKDFLVESGAEYIYGVQDRNKQPVWTEKRVIYFEHMYLYSEGKQLKLKFNPQVSSFKRTRQAAKQDTIGARYPTIFRNGYTDYAEFPINSLVSLQSDEENLFTTLELINTNLSDYNITQERKFREEVEKFLNNGKPKLFKSPTEGNFIVGLMNISFSPNATLGRMLYSVSATAYEIAENNMTNLMNLGIYSKDKLQQNDTVYFGQKPLDEGENLEILNSYFTKVEIYNNSSGTSIIKLNDNKSEAEEILPNGGILFYTENELENVNTITCTSGSVYVNYQWKQNDILEEEEITMLQKGKKVFGNGLINTAATLSLDKNYYYYNWVKDKEHLELVNIQIIFDPGAKEKRIVINNPDRYGPTEDYAFDYSGSAVNVYNFSSADFELNNIRVSSDKTFTVYYVEVVSV